MPRPDNCYAYYIVREKAEKDCLDRLEMMFRSGQVLDTPLKQEGCRVECLDIKTRFIERLSSTEMRVHFDLLSWTQSDLRQPLWKFHLHLANRCGITFWYALLKDGIPKPCSHSFDKRLLQIVPPSFRNSPAPDLKHGPKGWFVEAPLAPLICQLPSGSIPELDDLF